MKFFTPLILIGLAGGLFYWFINPAYAEIKTLRAQKTEYEKSLIEASDALARKDVLLNRYNTFSATQLDRMRKMIPDQVDSIQLIIDMNSIASRNGATIKNISVSDPLPGGSISGDPDAYGIVQMSFSIDMTYERFLQFIRDLEQSLRLMDIQSIDFKPAETGSMYTFNVSLKTYWLK